jgi:transcriptional regulator with XRE-family HTH domain
MGRPSNTTNLDGLAERIASLRYGMELSQAKLAAQIGVAPSSVALYETGQNRPALEQLIKLADIFGVTTDALLGRVPVKVREADAAALNILNQMPPARRKLALAMLRSMVEPAAAG